MNDEELRERLAAYPFNAIHGTFFRATLVDRDPLIASFRGGRWVPPDTKSVLYLSYSREGALAEMAFRLGMNIPIPQIPVRVHRIRISSPKALTLDRKKLESLEVDFSRYEDLDYDWTQQVGLAAFQVGATAIQVPCARWPTDNLIAVDEADGQSRIELIDSEVVDWILWARSNVPQYLSSR